MGMFTHPKEEWGDADAVIVALQQRVQRAEAELAVLHSSDKSAQRMLAMEQLLQHDRVIADTLRDRADRAEASLEQIRDERGTFADVMRIRAQRAEALLAVAEESIRQNRDEARRLAKWLDEIRSRGESCAFAVDFARFVVASFKEHDLPRDLVGEQMQIDRAEALLRKLEWAATDYDFVPGVKDESASVCPVCRAPGIKSDHSEGQHVAGCELAAIVGAKVAP